MTKRKKPRKPPKSWAGQKVLAYVCCTTDGAPQAAHMEFTDFMGIGAKDCRRLAAWLIRVAEYLESNK